MACDNCWIFHSGCLKGECRCDKCDCVWYYNRKLNEPIPTVQNKGNVE